MAWKRGPVVELTADEWSRFDSKRIPADSGCLAWTGETNSRGYGRFTVYRSGKRIRLLAHRLAFVRANGASPEAVRHSCDNPPCTDETHLLAGDQADNIADAIERGRMDTAGLDAWRAQRDAAADERVRTGQKRCARCRTTRPLADFNRHRGNRDGHQYECKACSSSTNRESRRRRTQAA